MHNGRGVGVGSLLPKRVGWWSVDGRGCEKVRMREGRGRGRLKEEKKRLNEKLNYNEKRRFKDLKEKKHRGKN